jgi:uncharacterized membrane protein
MGEHFHLHPLFVHFPVALFITAFGLETLGLIFKRQALQQAAWYNYILGAIAAMAAVLAAWWDGETLKHTVFYVHRNLAYITTAFGLASGIVLLIIKNKSVKLFRVVFFISLLLAATLVSMTGYWGGKLVYEYGVGVEE